MNTVNLAGRLTKDIELKDYGKGKEKGHYARFTLAVRDGVDKDGEPRTQFISCICWGKGSELLEQYCGKGDLIGINGKLEENNYEDENKVMHYTLQVNVRDIEFLALKKEEEEEEEKPRKKYGKNK